MTFEPPASLRETVWQLAQALVRLDTGPLARLRRMDVDGPGEGDFWKLASALDLKCPEDWLVPVRLMALITPKGQPGEGKRLHEPKTALGAALADAKYPERRLNQFLALPHDRRAEALERMVRWMAAKGHNGVNCTDICALLFSDGPEPARRLAETYYRTLDKAEQKETPQ